jgi:putative ABC transport system permease protein
MRDLRFWRWRRTEDDDLDREIETHLELATDEHLEAGLALHDAQLAAHRQFGSVALTKEELRDMRTGVALERMWQETRFAGRRLVRSPAFTLASVLTLALAIGANGSIFAVVERVVLNPLPYPESDRLVVVDHGAERENLPSGLNFAPGLYYLYSERARTLAGIAIYDTDELTLTSDGSPERIPVIRATPSLASVLRVSPAVGRWLAENDAVPGAPQVAVLSHGLWTRRYSGDRAIIGRLITLGGVATEVVGVMPAGYAFPDKRVDAWIAMQLSRSQGFGFFGRMSVARLRHGAGVADVQRELSGLIGDLPQAFPGDTRAAGNGREINLFPIVRTLKEATVGGVARALWILLASVGLVLFVACANVANLFLVRSETRQREVAVRRALGATRAGIARYFLSESLLLAGAGGVAGVAIAWGAVRLLVTYGPTNLPRLEEIRLDGVAVLFTFVVSVLAALAFAAIPLLYGSSLAASLHEVGRANTASRSRHRARRILMGGQVALALVLLVSSGLMVRSFQRLRAVDPGFDASSALTFALGLPDSDYPTRDAAVAAHHAILGRLSALPGVTAASVSTCLPLTFPFACYGWTLRVEGRVYPAGTIPPPARFRAVAGGYFETMGMRILRGRGINRGDVDRREPIVVINQALADQFFPKQNPIGQRVASSLPPTRTWLTIVGVVATTPTFALAEVNPIGQLFMPMSIAGGPESTLTGPNVAVMNYVVRSTTPASALLPSVRRAVDAVDPKLALAQVRTLQNILDGASAQMAFTMALIVIAAAVALLLGVIGICGAMSYIVSQRTGEIGVRLALGAEPGSVARMIVLQGGVVALAGVAVGLAAAFGGGRLIESLLYGISPRDPNVFAGMSVLLLGVVLLACWLPARRAARLSPLDALRAE